MGKKKKLLTPEFTLGAALPMVLFTHFGCSCMAMSQTSYVKWKGRFRKPLRARVCVSICVHHVALFCFASRTGALKWWCICSYHMH